MQTKTETKKQKYYIICYCNYYNETLAVYVRYSPAQLAE